MRFVSERTGSPIILDESFLRSEHLGEITGDPGHWIINVRVSKMGELVRSLALVEAARHSGLSIIVGAQVGETSVLTRAGLIARVPPARISSDTRERLAPTYSRPTSRSLR